MEEPLFDNVRLRKDTFYFLYVGELRAYGLSVLLRESLAKTLGRPVDFIAIAPDVFEAYAHENLVVINPYALRLSAQLGQRASCRTPSRAFAALVSGHPYVLRLVNDLLAIQNQLFVYMYESLPEMTLDRIAGVSILGPDKNVARAWNNRLYQQEKLTGVVPLPESRTCRGLRELTVVATEMLRVWPDGIFISLPFSAAGEGSTIVHSRPEIEKKVGRLLGGRDLRTIISQYIPNYCAPTVLAVVANEADVYIANVADQNIVGGNKFRGSEFPSALPARLLTEVKEYARKVGSKLGQAGYRGIFGCDFIVDHDQNLFLVEVNARKLGTTTETCCALENLLPRGSPSLPELEYFAVTENRFPANVTELDEQAGNIHWGTYNYKLEEDVSTRSSVPQRVDEREMFQAFAAGRSPGGQFGVFEHIGANCVVKAGSFLSRIVAVGGDHDAVQRGLEAGKAQTRASIAKEGVVSDDHTSGS